MKKMTNTKQSEEVSRMVNLGFLLYADAWEIEGREGSKGSYI